ncbi:Ankyrin repeat-containing protein [Rhynchospora pubera]|uniref:Ankyrin repeat-containing protein n=1 Tax=Rhynchospora pubera TaxID=906938 RepID=A0AAV8D4K5_9POAL|nr:Ankyrin repeat-containing protein [Rhynchospora pubera]
MGASSESNHAAPTPDKIEELVEAARYDELDDIVRLFSIGVPLDSKDSQGRTEELVSSQAKLQCFSHDKYIWWPASLAGTDRSISGTGRPNPVRWLELPVLG